MGVNPRPRSGTTDGLEVSDIGEVRILGAGVDVERNGAGRPGVVVLTSNLEGPGRGRIG